MAKQNFKLTPDQQKLVEDNHNLIYFCLNNRKLYEKNKEEFFFRDEDWYGIASIGLCKAAANFNPDLGYAFSTYAIKCIQAEINNAMLRENRKNGLSLGVFIMSYNEELDSSDSQCGDWLELLPDTVDVEKEACDRAMLDDIYGLLTERERVVIKAVYTGYSQREIGELIGCTQAHVGRIYSNIVDKAFRYKRCCKC